MCCIAYTLGAMGVRYFLLLLWIGSSSVLGSLSLDPLAPRGTLLAGAPAVLEVLARAQDGSGVLPEVLRVTWSAAGTLAVSTARLRSNPDAVAEGAVFVAAYAVTIPETLEGEVVLALEGHPGRVVVTITSAHRFSASQPEPVDPAAPARFDWSHPFFAHEPLYFLVGFHKEVDARFQLSFKYFLLGPGGSVDKSTIDPWLAPQGWYFGYTQTSLWDIADASSPFRDTSYRPSLFWHQHDVFRLAGRDGSQVFASLQAGFEHESNGRDEPQSRSLNVLFLRPFVGRYSSGGWRLLLSPKVHAFLDKDENEDLDQFRGYVDFLFSLRAPDDGLQIDCMARLGTRGSRGSLQTDVSYPARFLCLPGYLHFQAFHGWGETLLEYDARTDLQLRLGFSAIR